MLDKTRSKIQGPVFPIVTPFKDDYNIDYDHIKNYIDFLYDGGARIFYVTAHTSRYSLLTYDEMLKINKTVATYVKLKYNNCIVIVADPLYKSTQTSIDFAKKAEDDGSDLISLIFMERFYSTDQIYNFFETVANNCNIGILIHEEQLNTIHEARKINWPLDLLDKLANVDNIIAIKEDANQNMFTNIVIDKLKNRMAIIVSGGSKEQFMQFGPKGCQAYLVGIASFYPSLAIDFYNAYLSGNNKLCWKIINEIEIPFFKTAKKFGWHISLKSAMDLLNIMSRVERPPLIMLPKEQHKEIENVLKLLNNNSLIT